MLLEREGLLPMVVTMMSTMSWSSFLSSWETVSMSWALPLIKRRFVLDSGGTMAASVEGSRQRATHWWPAARVSFRQARPTPALAPIKATVIVDVDAILMDCCDCEYSVIFFCSISLNAYK